MASIGDCLPAAGPEDEAMGGRRRKGVGTVAAALAIVGVAALRAEASDATGAEPDVRTVPPALVEAATCAAPTPLPAVDGRRTTGDTHVSFQLPAVTRLRLVAGDVESATTNTGCTPRPTDRFVVGDRLATATEAAAALRVAWSGDWTTPGTWHPAG